MGQVESTTGQRPLFFPTLTEFLTALGIIVGLGVVSLLVMLIYFVCQKKQRTRRRLIREKIIQI